MTDTSTPVPLDDWPYSDVEELELLLERCYRDDDLDALGTAFEIEWFSEHQASADSKAARNALAEYVATTSDLQTLFEMSDPTPRVFRWFLGRHYAFVLDEDDPVIRSTPPTEEWDDVVSDVEEIVGESERLQAFVRGIIGAERRFHGRIRTDFSDANSRGNSHYDGDNRLWVSNQANVPGQITGIATSSTSSSGRSYSVAAELVPVIEAGVDQLEQGAAGPVSTPEQTVPDDLDRRVPKFEEVLDEISVTEEDIERFESILADHEALDYWADYVAPTVKFRDRAKRAILCLLASPEDEHGTKGRTNAILFGPPGTGKSAFKNFLVEEFGAFSIDGARVSKTDLTYNKNTGEDGLLVRAHKGLAVIEEADELDDDALGAALTALGEAGRIEIRDMRLPAEVRGILLGNYRSREEIVAAHSEAVFNRFEFVLQFDPLSDSERDAAIDWQYDHFRQPKSPENTSELKKYIAWVREFDPAIPGAELQKIKEFKQSHIDAIENVREGISILTVAYTIARLNHRELTVADYKTAFDLVTN